MSARDDEIAERIRSVLGLRPDIEEKRMFGGIAFMLNGNMLVGTLKGGGLLARSGKDNYADALQRPGAGPMTVTGRTMGAFVQVTADGIETDEALADWIAFAEGFVRTLPPK